MRQDVVTDAVAHLESDRSFAWPLDVTIVRERFIADTVASNLRHEVLNAVTSMGNACYLLKRHAAQSKPAGEALPLLDHLVRNVAGISRVLDVRYVPPPTQGAACCPAEELQRLVREVESPTPWTVATTPDVASATITMPRDEFRAAVSCAVEGLAARSKPNATVNLNLSAGPDAAITVTASATRNDPDSGAGALADDNEERYAPPWLEIARRILMRRGGAAHSVRSDTIALRFQR